MISVLVLGSTTAVGRSACMADTIRTLTALVPGTVEGIIRDVILLGVASNPDLAKIADHAGCILIEEKSFSRATKAGARLARCDVLLVLPAGVTFDRSLSDEMAVAALRLDAGSRESGLRLRSQEKGPLGRLMPRVVPTIGILVPRANIEAADARDFPALVRACRPSRSFKTAAWTGE